MSTETEDDWRYWKAALSCLPTQESRDAAWEFFVRHFSQNPKMADTLSGLILILQANGLYMLEAPRMVQVQVVDPLQEALTRFNTELNQTIDRHQEIATEVTQSTEVAVTAIKGFEGAIRSGWQQVNAANLAERVHAELETTLLQPLATQCRALEQAAPAVNNALERMENSARQLRGYHFKSILAAMLVSCLAVAGGCFVLGWSKLCHHYDLKVKAALEQVVSVNATNEETFIQLTKMSVPIRVVPVVDQVKGKTLLTSKAVMAIASAIVPEIYEIDAQEQKFLMELVNKHEGRLTTEVFKGYRKLAQRMNQERIAHEKELKKLQGKQ